MKKTFFFALLIAGLIAFAGCGGGGGGGAADAGASSDEVILDLGEPGEATGESTLRARDNVFELQDNEEIVRDLEAKALVLATPTRTYQPGDILFETDHSAIQKVVAVDEADGKTVLHVEAATLEEAFADGSLSFRVTPAWGPSSIADTKSLQKPAEDYFTRSVLAEAPLDKAGRARGTLSADGTLNLDDTSLFSLTIDNTTGSYGINWAQSTLMGESLSQKEGDACVDSPDFEGSGHIAARIAKGQLKMVPTIEAEYTFKDILKNASCRFDMEMIFEAVVEVSCDGQMSFETSKELLPPLSYTATIPMPPPAPPLIMDITLEMPASVSLDTSVNGLATFTYKSTRKIQVTLESSKDGDYTYTKKFSTPREITDVNLFAEGHAGVTLALHPKVSVKLYKVLGPFIEVSPYLTGCLTQVTNNGTLDWKAGEDDFILGITGSAGLAMDFGVKTYDWQTPKLFDISKGWDIKKPSSSPSVFVIRQPENGGTLSLSSPSFAWSPHPQADHYFIRVMKNDGAATGSYTTIWDESGITGTSIPFNHDGTAWEDLTAGGTYRVRIYAQSASQTGVPDTDTSAYIATADEYVFTVR